MIRRAALFFAPAIVAAVVVSVLSARNVAGDWINWEVLALALAGFGTLALAAVTRELVTSSNVGIHETQRLATLAERDQEARIRPVVLLWQDPRWFEAPMLRSQRLPIVNAGGGAALNVNAQVYWHAGNCALATSSIGPGEQTHLYARTLIGGFDETWGRITYSDTLGRRWETKFVILTDLDGQPRFELRAYGLRDRFPDVAYPAGWELNDHGLPRLALPQIN